MKGLGPFAAAFALVAATAWAQGDPLGPEFRVNAYATSSQSHPSVTADGNFVVVWESAGQDGSSDGVFGQHYFGGTPFGPEFRANSYTTNAQRSPDVVSGNSFVVWTSDSQDGSSLGIFAQRYLSANPFGPEFQVNTFTTDVQSAPSVAKAGPASGDFVVVWQAFLQDGSGYGVFGQRFDSSGGPIGSEFRVNTYTTGHQYTPVAAAGLLGEFMVVWTSADQDGSGAGIFGQRFSDLGAPLGGEFRVNAYTTNDQRSPRMGEVVAGIAPVVWMSDQQDGSGWGVIGRPVSLSFGPAGPEFQVNTYTAGNQYLPSTASDGAGHIVVVWQSAGQDGAGMGIFGQRYLNQSGMPSGPEFRVNTYTTGDQSHPDVGAATVAAGGFLVVWDGPAEDGSPGLEVYGQRFGPIFPVELMHLGVE